MEPYKYGGYVIYHLNGTLLEVKGDPVILVTSGQQAYT